MLVWVPAQELSGSPWPVLKGRKAGSFAGSFLYMATDLPWLLAACWELLREMASGASIGFVPPEATMLLASSVWPLLVDSR